MDRDFKPLQGETCRTYKYRNGDTLKFTNPIGIRYCPLGHAADHQIKYVKEDIVRDKRKVMVGDVYPGYLAVYVSRPARAEQSAVDVMENGRRE